MGKTEGKSDMKLITFYLPQYHCIPENDAWWGKGFTEWANVKGAKPFFKDHYQPRIPLNKKYYDLSDDSVMVNQMKLARKYGIYGFCFYHYWFAGKTLLEMPVERILQNRQADLPFCLSWANEPWTRAWDGIEGQKNVLMPQNYGGEKEWEEHFNYLLPFFKDFRYIKEDGKPVLIIYKAEQISHCRKMLDKWRLMACQNGFKGLYIIKTIGIESHPAFSQGFDAMINFEPNATWQRYMRRGKENPFFPNWFTKKDKVTIIDYEKFCQCIVNKRDEAAVCQYLGAFPAWDNTARRGKDGVIYQGSTPERFKKYLSIQLKESKKAGKDYIFVNAWNEWGEGAYLEPDERYGYAYLKALKEALAENEE